MEEVEPKFTKVLEGKLGAEGPVFDRDDNFYMVAPEVMKNGNFLGQVLSVDLKTNKVRSVECHLCQCGALCYVAQASSKFRLCAHYSGP
jgi:hypothetical protein